MRKRDAFNPYHYQVQPDPWRVIPYTNVQAHCMVHPNFFGEIVLPYLIEVTNESLWWPIRPWIHPEIGFVDIKATRWKFDGAQPEVLYYVAGNGEGGLRRLPPKPGEILGEIVGAWQPITTTVPPELVALATTQKPGVSLWTP